MESPRDKRDTRAGACAADGGRESSFFGSSRSAQFGDSFCIWALRIYNW